jgi:hypothetical protein
MPQGNVELMTEKQVLRFKPAPRLEQIGDISSKQVDDRKHRIGYCVDSASPRESTGRTFRERQGARSLSWTAGVQKSSQERTFEPDTASMKRR